MSIKVATDSPLARALQDVVSPKLAEVGWSSGMQDDTLTEYIILMLANGKSQDQIASELSNDLLSLPPEDQSAAEFSRWLFEQVALLDAQMNGGAPTGQQADVFEQAETMDSNMSDADGSKPIPTGPKSMAKGGRVVNQINKAMDRSRDNNPLHRIRGNGRVNSHSSRDPPRGPRNQSIQRNMQAAMNGRGGGQMGNMMNGSSFANMPGQIQNWSPQQQMQLFSMFEQSAAMMAQLAGQANFTPGSEPGFTGGRGRGRPLHERIGGKGRGQGRRNFNNQNGQSDNQDTAMGEDGEGEGDAKDAYHTVCKFNLQCTKVECPFAHQSPAAPPGTPIDTSSECTYGAACKNHKCAARHPSPAKKWEHQKQQDCLYGPSCANPNCSFKHSDMPACRNGADCTTTGCRFFHSKIPCKFTPCTNPRCPYKHKEGQKSEVKNVWTSDKDHVSDRKFVNEEEGPEELIIPGGETAPKVDADGDVVA